MPTHSAESVISFRGEDEPEGDGAADIDNAALLARWLDDDADGFSRRDVTLLETMIEDFGIAKVLGMLAELTEAAADEADDQADQLVGRPQQERQARADLWRAQSLKLGAAAVDSLADEAKALGVFS